MRDRKPLDHALTQQLLRDMPPGDLRDAYENLLAHAATLDGYECGATRKRETSPDFAAICRVRPVSDLVCSLRRAPGVCAQEWVVP